MSVTIDAIEYTLNSTTLTASIASITDASTRTSAAIPATISVSSVVYAVTGINDNVFKNCTLLATVTLSEGLVDIGKNAFEGCSAITSITIPASVNHLRNFAFWKCTLLATVVVSETPFGVLSRSTVIYESVFCECLALTQVTLPVGVTSIGISAFQGCTSLTSVTIPSNVTTLGVSTFQACTALTTVVFSVRSTPLTISGNMFYGCTALTTLMLLAGVTGIGPAAFQGCRSLTSVVVPQGVVGLQVDAFNGCVALRNVTLPDSVATIESTVFFGCTALTTLTFPASITSLGSNICQNCASLTNVIVRSHITTVGFGMFTSISPNARILFFGATSAASLSGSWNTRVLGFFAFKYYFAPTSLDTTFRYAVTSLTDAEVSSVFAPSTLSSATIPATCVIPNIAFIYNITSIGAGAFQNCTALTSVTIPSSITRIGDNAFHSCTSLNTLLVPASVLQIGASVVYNCPQLQSVTIAQPATCVPASTSFSPAAQTVLWFSTSVLIELSPAWLAASSVFTTVRFAWYVADDWSDWSPFAQSLYAAWTAPTAIVPPAATGPGAFSYAISPSGAATVAGDVLTVLAAGTATLTVAQAATQYYPSATATALVEILAFPLTGFAVDADVEPNEWIPLVPPQSTLPASMFVYSSSNPTVISIDGSQYRVNGVSGTSVITATRVATNVDGDHVEFFIRYAAENRLTDLLETRFQLTANTENRLTYLLETPSNDPLVVVINGSIAMSTRTLTLVGDKVMVSLHPNNILYYVDPQ